jgi:hypothetical protein
MDKTITQHLKKLKLKPRSDNYFKEVASELIGKNVNSTKEAKVIVRKTISDGQVDASNDNVEGLKNQVISEQQGGGTHKYSRQAKAYIFNKSAFDHKSAEKYLDDKKIQYGRPKDMENYILLPLDSINKDDRLITKKINENVSILHTI